MEVDLFRLRDAQGRKLPGDVVRAATPLHGFLQLNYWRLKNEKEDRLVKELILKAAPDATSRPMATLTGAQQTRLRGESMVYVGTERTAEGVEYQQAWLCRLTRHR